MAEASLNRTAESDISLAITGHLEDDASADGPLAYVGIAIRNDDVIESTLPARFNLTGKSRLDRQWEAAALALGTLIDRLSAYQPESDNMNELNQS